MLVGHDAVVDVNANLGYVCVSTTHCPPEREKKKESVFNLFFQSSKYKKSFSKIYKNFFLIKKIQTKLTKKNLLKFSCFSKIK
jgi:hypothetical protein